jgi:hypothetical protein
MRFAIGDRADAGLLGVISVEPCAAGDERENVVVVLEGTWV